MCLVLYLIALAALFSSLIVRSCSQSNVDIHMESLHSKNMSGSFFLFSYGTYIYDIDHFQAYMHLRDIHTKSLYRSFVSGGKIRQII